MIVEDQSATIEFLEDPATYGAQRPPERRTTHISHIFLTGDRAHKLKRAVKFAYADFSTAERRLALCMRELELNRRAAPDLYLGVRRITRKDDGGLSFDGPGELVDAVVEMARFGDGDLFDVMAVEGRLTPDLIKRTADSISTFHDQAEMIKDADAAQRMAMTLQSNRASFAESGIFSMEEITRLNTALSAMLDRHEEALNERAGAGLVIRGHGDLHLGNLCLFDGEPTLFDCIEFNEQIATVDTLYDLAFLTMDLWHRDLPALANLAANRYCDLRQDEGWVLLPFFMAVRAAIRAHVNATLAAEQPSDPQRGETARSYFDLAQALTNTVPGSIMAIGGLSGSGKSTIADRLAPGIGVAPGARVLESDRIRKAMHGVAPQTRLPESAYAPEVSRRVYEQMAEMAEKLARQGCTVIANAVFAEDWQRQAIAKAAREAGISFRGLWLDVPADTLRTRVSARRGAVSDAGLSVLESQLASIETPDDWETVDGAGTVEETVDWISGPTVRA